MEIYLGEKGLNKTWQSDFPKNTECYKCKSNARIMFVGLEKEEKEFVCDLHQNKEGSYWLHDAMACAVYLCEKCFEPTALINQA